MPAAVCNMDYANIRIAPIAIVAAHQKSSSHSLYRRYGGESFLIWL